MIDAWRRTGRLDGRSPCDAVTIRIDGAHVGAVGACQCDTGQRWIGVPCTDFHTAPEGDHETMRGLSPQARGFPIVSWSHVEGAHADAAPAGEQKRATRAEFEAKNPFVEGDKP